MLSQVFSFNLVGRALPTTFQFIAATLIGGARGYPWERVQSRLNRNVCDWEYAAGPGNPSNIDLSREKLKRTLLRTARSDALVQATKNAMKT